MTGISDSVKFRTARPVDDLFISVLESAEPGGWGAGTVRAALASLPAAVATRAGVAVGWALWRPTRRGARLLRLAVSPPWRRQGLGTALLGEAQARCAAAGRLRLTARVREDDLAALKTLRRAGFLAVGTRRGHYGDLDAVRMRWDDAAPF